jgi:hypothetical protein
MKSDAFNTLVLAAIVSLLENPNPEDALVASVGEVYTTNRAKFNKTAKDYVKKVNIVAYFTDSAFFNPLLFSMPLPNYSISINGSERQR